MRLHWANRLCAGLVALSATCFPLSSQAIAVGIEQFSVTRNGSNFLTDTFEDGAEPSSGPFGATTYFVGGTIPNTAESGGRLLLDSANGFTAANATGAARLFVGVTLLTNPNSADLTSGLKSDDTLLITGTFGLVTPTGPLFSGYGIGLIDAGADGTTHQQLQLAVRFNVVTGQAEVFYILQDFDANTITLLGVDALAAPVGADAIQFSLSRPNVANDDFLGSYSYLSGGIGVGGGSFALAGQMFQGENFVRAQFFAAEGVPVPEPGAAHLAVMGLLMLMAAARRRA